MKNSVKKREIRFPVKVVVEKEHKFIFKNYENKNISHLVSLLISSQNVEVSFIIENDKLKLQLCLPAPKKELIEISREEGDIETAGLGF